MSYASRMSYASDVYQPSRVRVNGRHRTDLTLAHSRGLRRSHRYCLNGRAREIMPQYDLRRVAMPRNIDRSHLAHTDSVPGSFATQWASHRKIRITWLRDGGALPFSLRQ